MSLQHASLEWYIWTLWLWPWRARKSLPYDVPCLSLSVQSPSGERQVARVNLDETRWTGHSAALAAGPEGAEPSPPPPQPAARKTKARTRNHPPGRITEARVWPWTNGGPTLRGQSGTLAQASVLPSLLGFGAPGLD